MPEVLYEKKGKIAYITLNRPEAFNAVTMNMWRELAKITADFQNDPEMWAAIVTGSGDKAFCAGADLKEIDQLRREDDKSGKHFLVPAPYQTITRDMRVWKPIIAAVNGLALGGGLEIALSCDIIIAAENAKLGVPEVKAGVIPGMGGTQRLPRAIPFKIALEMLMTGDPLSAQDAYRVGLVSKVVPLAQLMPTAEAMANRINENAPLAVRAAKECATRGIRMSLDDGLRLEHLQVDVIFQTEDGREGPNAFASKRKPNWKGK